MEILNSHLTINVSDIDVSVAFYLSIGFKLDQRWEDHYAQLSAPGIEVGLHPSSGAHGAENRQALSIGFTSPDFDGVAAELTRLGIPFSERIEDGGHFLHFQDSDGTPLYFIKPKW